MIGHLLISDQSMSALPPKADMCSAQAHVCFGPIADSCTAAKSIVVLFDHLVGPAKQGERQRKSENL
jgi:hypothetical protein